MLFIAFQLKAHQVFFFFFYKGIVIRRVNNERSGRVLNVFVILKVKILNFKEIVYFRKHIYQLTYNYYFILGQIQQNIQKVFDKNLKKLIKYYQFKFTDNFF